MRFFRSVGGLFLGEDELKLLEKLRRERQQEPRIWVARAACALAAALTGFGTNWLIGLLLAALALTGKRARQLAYGCFFGAILAAALFIDAIAADSNIYGALFLFGLPAVMFALGFVLVLTTGVTLFGHSLALRRLRREHDVDGLIARLASSDPVTRAKAADVLAPLADPRAEQPLLRALADPDLDVCANAARALGVLKSEAAVDLLLQTLGDEESDVRYAAAWALGQIGDERAIEPLLRLVTDQDDLVKDAARDALQSLGTAAAPG
jgi:hypothetical protein